MGSAAPLLLSSSWLFEAKMEEQRAKLQPDSPGMAFGRLGVRIKNKHGEGFGRIPAGDMHSESDVVWPLRGRCAAHRGVSQSDFRRFDELGRAVGR
jgi:hypothetical protein